MAKCWPWNHHWHCFKTTLKWKSDDCVGEKVRWYRCCRCRIIRSLMPMGAMGEAEHTMAYDVSDIEAIRA